jgi:hypothetical protein
MTSANGPRALLLVMLTLLGVACDPSDPCDPGYYEEHGSCYPLARPPEDAGDTGSDEGDDDGGALTDAESTDPPADPYAGFGDACEEQSDCPNGLICGAPQLALCTQVNCLDDATVCPPDWICYDTMGASPDPSVTSVCLNL